MFFRQPVYNIVSFSDTSVPCPIEKDAANHPLRKQLVPHGYALGVFRGADNDKKRKASPDRRSFAFCIAHSLSLISAPVPVSPGQGL